MGSYLDDNGIRISVYKGGTEIYKGALEKLMEGTTIKINGNDYGSPKVLGFIAGWSGYDLSPYHDSFKQKINKEIWSDNPKMKIEIIKNGEVFLSCELPNQLTDEQKEKYAGPKPTGTTTPPVVLNKQPLEDAIATAKGLDKTNKTQESIEKLTTAITEAEGILKSATTQAEIQAAADKLAGVKLEEKVVLNKKPLEDAIATAEGLDKTNKTQDSIEKLTTAINAAKESLKTAKTQEEIQAAADKLAKVKLVAKPAESSVKPIVSVPGYRLDEVARVTENELTISVEDTAGNYLNDDRKTKFEALNPKLKVNGTNYGLLKDISTFSLGNYIINEAKWKEILTTVGGISKITSIEVFAKDSKPPVTTEPEFAMTGQDLKKDSPNLLINLTKDGNKLSRDEIKKIIDNETITINGTDYKLSVIGAGIIDGGIRIPTKNISKELEKATTLSIKVGVGNNKFVEGTVNNEKREATTPASKYSISEQSTFSTSQKNKLKLVIGKDKQDMTDSNEIKEFLKNTKIKINEKSFGTMKEAGFKWDGPSTFSIDDINSLKDFTGVKEFRIELVTDGETYSGIVNRKLDNTKPAPKPVAPTKIVPVVSVEGYELKGADFTKVTIDKLEIGIKDKSRNFYLDKEGKPKFEALNPKLKVNGKDYGALKDIATFSFGTYKINSEKWKEIIKEVGGFDKITTIEVVKGDSKETPKPKPEPTVNKDPLKTALDNANDEKTTAGKTEKSVEEFKKVVAEAQKVLDDPKATQEQVNAAKKSIEDAEKKLEDKPKEINKADLKTAIDEEKKSETTAGKTEESVKKYKEAIAEAQKVFDNPKATQEEIDAAVKAVKDAKENLVDKLEVVKLKLKETILTANKYKKENYTAKSYKELEDAIVAGKKVFNDPNATQKEVEEARRAIEEAIKNLKEDLIDLEKEYGKYADAFTYTDKTIIDRAGEDKYFNVKGGVVSMLERAGRAAEKANKKDRRIDKIIGVVQAGFSKELENKDYRVGAFVEFDSQIANHYMLGATFKHKDDFKAFARYRLANYKGANNHNIDLYGTYANRIALSNSSYVEPRLGLYLTYSGETKLDKKVNLKSRFGYLADVSVKAAKRYNDGLEVYIRPELRAGNNDQKLEQVGTSNSVTIKKSNVRGSVELGASKAYENGITPMMSVRVKSAKNKEVGVDVRLGASYKW
ncbi:MAG: FIVAR domain-containing protein [Fusobacterium sp.]|nr:FIVAR domain-containing protein [Fusobacterium sp.]